MSEWLAVEAIVRQREKEQNAKALAKISLENKCNDSSVPNKFTCESTEKQNYNNDLDNDVFDDHDNSDFSDTGIEFDDDVVNNIGNCEEKLENDVDESFTSIPYNGEKSRTRFENERNVKILENREVTFNDKNKQGSIDLKKEEQVSSAEIEESYQEAIVRFENLDFAESLVLQDNCFAETELEMVYTPDQSALLLLSIKSSPSTSSYETVGNEFVDAINNTANVETEEISQDDAEEVSEDNNRKYHSVDDVRYGNKRSNGKPTHAVIITQAASNDTLECMTDEHTEDTSRKTSLTSPINEDITVVASLDALKGPKSPCVSPASSNGGVYSVSFLRFNYLFCIHNPFKYLIVGLSTVVFRKISVNVL